MSSITITVEDIPSFIENNIPSLDKEVLYKSPNNGGFKSLKYGGNRLYIIVSGIIHRMRYKIKEKVSMEISEDTHNLLQELTRAIHQNTGITTRGVSYEGADGFEGFWLRGQLLGHEGKFFTTVYKKVSESNEYEEIFVTDCPNSFRGMVCLEVRGMFINNLKDKDSEVFLRNEFSEILVKEVDVSSSGGSRIMKLLGGVVVTKPKEDPKKEESEEFMW
eukprot:TRINITY_DN4766_c0_g1_i1.p1 TRINITY_DN4766_c0_g1~~TRINITY_DN4766_c0_g1_i1.p1  ORF type:complete len:219 (+),score=44.43 TRINITY_DN4766_c0_g1_i1:40-696(+)